MATVGWLGTELGVGEVAKDLRFILSGQLHRDNRLPLARRRFFDLALQRCLTPNRDSGKTHSVQTTCLKFKHQPLDLITASALPQGLLGFHHHDSPKTP